jgi:hypothetical protein
MLKGYLAPLCRLHARLTVAISNQSVTLAGMVLFQLLESAYVWQDSFKLICQFAIFGINIACKLVKGSKTSLG